MRESKIRTAFLAAIVSISVLSAAIPLATILPVRLVERGSVAPPPAAARG